MTRQSIAPAVGAARLLGTASGAAIALTLAFSSLVLALPVRLAAQTAPVVVASKPFGESFLLSELFAQLLEARGIAVTRRPGLGATEIAFRALQDGAIDIYPEYTGTGLRVLLADSTTGLSPEATWRWVAEASRRRWGIQWLPPLGFENGYAIAVTPAAARQLATPTLAALRQKGAALRAGLTPDFIGRDDGLPRLRARAGWAPAEVRPLAPALKYTALAAGAVDLIDAYATDGRLAAAGLVVLADDVGAFPSYAAAAVVGARVAETRPDVVAALTLLSGRLTAERVREWNRRIELNGETPAQVAADVLRELGLRDGPVPLRPAAEGRPSPWAAAWDARRTLRGFLGRHLLLVAVSLAVALVVGGGLGAALGLSTRSPEPVLRLLGAVQTIPALALLALAIPWLGVGPAPALLALWLYALYPIVQGTCTGLRQVDPRLLETGRALGLTPWQRLRDIHLPLALPALLAGVRTATVLTIGGATLAAFVGAGGLGEPIATGLALGDHGQVLLGAVPAALLALLTDAALGEVTRRLTPAHLRRSPPRG